MAGVRDLRSSVGVADGILAAILGILTLIEIWYVAAAAPIAFGRAAPLRAFAMNIVPVMLLVGLTEPSNFYQWTQLAAAFFVAVYVRQWWAWLSLPISLASVFFYFQRFADELDTRVTSAILAWVAVWLVGRVYGAANELEATRKERDLSVALAAAQQARLEHEADRRMLAQEVHDIVGHSLNVMLVHAGAARGALPADVGQAQTALGTIESAGRAALDDLDRVLGLLQPTAAEAALAPQPGLDDLHTLVENAAGPGLDVTLRASVDPDQVPRPQQLALYRVVQEAITNAVKHAQASKIEVAVELDQTMATVTVVDDGCGLGNSTPGRGRQGMAARAEALGGSLATMSTAQGGTSVTCSLPVTS